MAEPKKGGFHALEQRIHQLEDEDARQERTRTAAERHEGAMAPAAPRHEPETKHAPTRR